MLKPQGRGLETAHVVRDVPQVAAEGCECQDEIVEAGGWQRLSPSVEHPRSSELHLGAQNPAPQAWQAALSLSPHTQSSNELIH